MSHRTHWAAWQRRRRCMVLLRILIPNPSTEVTYIRFAWLHFLCSKRISAYMARSVLICSSSLSCFCYWLLLNYLIFKMNQDMVYIVQRSLNDARCEAESHTMSHWIRCAAWQRRRRCMVLLQVLIPNPSTEVIYIHFASLISRAAKG
jgi:hypothetical protein